MIEKNRLNFNCYFLLFLPSTHFRFLVQKPKPMTGIIYIVTTVAVVVRLSTQKIEVNFVEKS